MAKKKFDKEVLLKNRFWIMLGTVGLLIVIAWLMLMISGSSAGDALQKTFEGKVKTLEGSAKQTPKTEAFRRPWEDYGEKFSKQKDGVWKQAWDLQADMYTWPGTNKARFPDLKNYTDEVGPDSNQARFIYSRELYAKQFDDLPKSVAPVEFKDGETGFNQIMAPALAEAGGGGGLSGKGPGRSGGGSGSMPSMPSMPMPGGGDTRRGGGGGIPPGMPLGGPSGGAAGGRAIDTLWPKDAVPTMEEIWLAQEDFWVKREMLSIVQAAQAEYSHFQPVEVPKDEPLPDKIVARHRFRNPYWEITLLVEESKGRTSIISPHSTIRNISKTGRTLLVGNARTGQGLKFTLNRGISTFTMTVAGEPLPPNGFVEFRQPITSDSFDFRQPFEMDQVLDWATSPVRRIDELRTAKNNHRLAFKPLKHNDQLYKEPEKDPNAADTSKGSNPGAPPQPAMPMPMPGGGGGGPPPMPGVGVGLGGQEGGLAGGGAGSATPNGLERDRYLLTNEQCRHLPIAMVLVVDQAAVNDVLIAVANSRLRIQITQIALLHVHDPGPTPVEGTLDTPAGPPPGPGRSGPPPFPGSGFPTTGTEPTQGEDNNLFELTIYGVATLYERYQDKSLAPTTPGTPGTPVTPGGPTPPK